MVEQFHSDDERGFTLVELLVTVLVIAILSASAAQVFLHQRRKGWMAQVVSATKNLASVQEYWFNTVGTGGYTPSLDNLMDEGFNFSADDVFPQIVAAGTRSFCLEVRSRHDNTIVWHYDSSVGRPEPGPIESECLESVLVADAGSNTPPVIPASELEADSPGESSTGTVDLSGSGSNGSSTTGGGGSTTGGTSSGTDTTSTSSTSGSGTSGSETTGGSADGSCDQIDGTWDGAGTFHPSDRDRSTESGGSGEQGDAEADPDGDSNGGADQTGGGGGADTSDQDGNNGSGNDTDFEDDNQGPDGNGGATGSDGTCTEDASGTSAFIPW